MLCVCARLIRVDPRWRGAAAVLLFFISFFFRLEDDNRSRSPIVLCVFVGSASSSGVKCVETVDVMERNEQLNGGEQGKGHTKKIRTPSQMSSCR